MDPETLARLNSWDAVLDEVDYYEILGVERGAGDAAIRQAFHRFAQSFHPDQHPDLDAAASGALRRVFQCGTEAYRVLSHAELRVRYDMRLAKGTLRLNTSLLPPPPPVAQGPKALDELARSAGAKLHAKKADALLAAGDLSGAKEQLQAALRYDGNANIALEERLDAIEIALYAMGGS